MKRIICIIMLLLLIPLAIASPRAPSEYYGLVNGGIAPSGASISASIKEDSSISVSASILDYSGETWYSISAPGDDPETPEVEGANPGDTIEVYIEGEKASPSLAWVEGSNDQIDLSYTKNYNPECNSLSEFTNEDVSKDIDLECNDQNGDSLTYHTSIPSHGSLSGSGSSITYEPHDNYHGSDSFTYYATDGVGGTSSTVTVSITVNSVNDAPIANDIDMDIDRNSENNIITLDCDDVEGDDLTYHTKDNPSNGLITSSDGTTRTYKPNSEYLGTDYFTYYCNDQDLDSNTATVSITIVDVNHDPDSTNDEKTIDEDSGEIDIDVLANDDDEDGDTITIISATQPNEGSSGHTADRVSYKPDSDFYGTDSFTYTISDGRGGSDTATVTVTVDPVNDAPIAYNINEEIIIDTPVTIILDCEDIDDNNIDYIITSDTENGATYLQNDEITYTPEQGFAGTDSLMYKCNDGKLDSNQATVNINIIEEPANVDLIPHSYAVLTSPVLEDTDLLITFEIRNDGEEAVETVEFLIDTNSEDPNLEYETYDIGPGGNRIVIALIEYSDPGNYNPIIIVDPNNIISETNEDNNRIQFGLEVMAKVEEECIPTLTCDSNFECGIIVDSCGNPVKCGICDEGYTCRRHECIAEEPVCRSDSPKELGLECGVYQDSCGDIHKLGYCTDGEICENNLCIEKCEPVLTCPAEYSCGMIDNGCQSEISCGICGEGFFCEDNLCVPLCISKLPSGLECGRFIDNCGRSYQIGSCKTGLVCINYQCEEDEPVCKPLSNCPESMECGVIYDGCGGDMSCGSCKDGYTCNDNLCEAVCLAKLPSGLECGKYIDNCGKKYNFESCDADEECSNNRCKIKCNSNVPSSLNCGTYIDNCGNENNLGSCSAGEECKKNICTETEPVCNPVRICPTDYECGTFENGCGGNIICGRCSRDEICKNNVCINRNPVPIHPMNIERIPLGPVKIIGEAM